MITTIIFTVLLLIMLRRGRLRRHRLPPSLNPGPRLSDAQKDAANEFLDEDTDFQPTPQDVFAVRALLKSLHLPTEIVLSILAFAGYDARLHALRCTNAIYSASLGQRNSIAVLYLTAPPMPHPDRAKGQEEFKARRVAFKMRSADQGWGGDDPAYKGTYRGSWSWFDATILRPMEQGPVVQEPLEKSERFRNPGSQDHDVMETLDGLRELGWDFVEREQGGVAWRVQANVTASSELKVHEVEWLAGKELVTEENEGKGDGQGFVEKIRPGDVVALWALARYPGWINRVNSASIEVHYDV